MLGVRSPPETTRWFAGRACFASVLTKPLEAEAWLHPNSRGAWRIRIGADEGRKGGAARGIRTPDPVITNDVLYQLSYCGDRERANEAARNVGS